MKVLILKLNATGDVVRTTSLLHRLEGEITWITAESNVALLRGVRSNVRCLAWEDRMLAADTFYDLAISLEDEPETVAFLREVQHRRVFGASASPEGVRYGDDAVEWFDMSLISRHGRVRADELKLLNRRTYQEMIFAGLGYRFENEPYVLPSPATSSLYGDVAIAPVAGPIWPMKNWAHYDELRRQLEATGLCVNVLPKRATLTEHLGDIANHRCLVSGDSLPMHLALGLGVRCVTLFNCTSPWEIHDYGVQTKLISPLLAEFFYKRGMDTRAVTAIGVEEVLSATLKQLVAPSAAT